jgi:hypothetical protein
MSTVPYIFATQNGNIPLSELDANFANIKANVDYAAVAGYVLTAVTVTASAQPNITSVGNSLTVSGNITTGNITGTGATFTGNIAGGNITGATATFTGNITGNIAGNITGTTATLTGNVTAGNVTAGNITGNITGNIAGNIAGTTATFTGNITGGNILGTSATFISNVSSTGATFTGNITTGNISGTSATFTSNVSSTGATFTGNVTTGNLTASTTLNNQGLEFIRPNYISVSSNTTATLSNTRTYNLIAGTDTGYTLTINMPVSPLNGQVTRFAINGNAITLVAGTGNVSYDFSGLNQTGNSYGYVYGELTGFWTRLE